MSVKKLSIIIPVFNRYAFTRACLQDLSQLPDDHEIILVDNGSSDETQEQLKNNLRIRYLRNPINLGFAKACNAGYYWSTAPHVLFLNNDTRIKSNFTDWTASLISEDSLVGPTMGELDSRFDFIREAKQLLTSKHAYMSGWCLCASKKVWNKLVTPHPPHDIRFSDEHYPMNNYPQIFSEEFGLAYFEDTDLSFRAKKLNIPFKVVNIPVVHFGRISSAQINTHQLYRQAKQIFEKKWRYSK